MNDTELLKVSKSLINRTGSGSGAQVAPLQSGQNAVPLVTNVGVTATPGPIGTNFTLNWLDVVGVPGVVVDHYNIYAINVLTNRVYASNSAFKSPGFINVLQPGGTPVTIIVQTCLASGLISPIALCPRVTSTCNTKAGALL